MRRYRAAWALPIAGPPIEDALFAIDRGRIVSVGSDGGQADVELGSVVVLPGLVNSHTHIELSALAGRVAPAATMPQWVAELLVARRDAASGAGEAPEPEVNAAIERAIVDLRRHGTALVGDVSNTLATVDPLRQSPLAAVVFHEILGFNPSDADAAAARAADTIDLSGDGDVRVSLAAHAPYSVAPSLFEALRRVTAARDPDVPLTVHLAESAEELGFLADGRGPWRQLLERLGVWNPSWRPPACGSVEFLERVGWLDSRVVTVHGVQLQAVELAVLAQRGMTLVTCPRSNEWTGAGTPPVERFVEAGVRLAVGTDSLASAPDLNLFAELARLRALAPEVAASVFLAGATITGARALGWDNQFGTIEPGKRAALIAVALPATVVDVEEYLLSGIDASQIAWVEDVE
ncbi:MAG: amidohydrolase family protein [Vicinamibacterales bacterium]|jgi:cytosine/adenosine deaminase-related metal-dependent hydrolase|nr:hypothetical protein [Acidobacteriota bacterium]MDP7672691.1 amidohydrolase family protein [Vicinamibacterales bacterium]HJO38877.1 amidohydrolase family protein [Vicinamibacterales bacterium]